MTRRRTTISYVGLDQSDSDEDFADHIADDVPARSRLKRARHLSPEPSPEEVRSTMSPKAAAIANDAYGDGEVVPDTSDESTPQRAGSDADAEPEPSPATTPARTRTPARSSAAGSDSEFDPDDESDFDPDPEPEPPTPPPKSKKRSAAASSSKSKPKAKPKAKTGVGVGRVSKSAAGKPGGLKPRRTGITIPTSAPRVPGATGRRPRRVGLSRTANVPRLLKSYKG